MPYLSYLSPVRDGWARIVKPCACSASLGPWIARLSATPRRSPAGVLAASSAFRRRHPRSPCRVRGSTRRERSDPARRSHLVERLASGTPMRVSRARAVQRLASILFDDRCSSREELVTMGARTDLRYEARGRRERSACRASRGNCRRHLPEVLEGRIGVSSQVPRWSGVCSEARTQRERDPARVGRLPSGIAREAPGCSGSQGEEVSGEGEDAVSRSWPCGGTGRRGGFKIHCPGGHSGSTPDGATKGMIRGKLRLSGGHAQVQKAARDARRTGRRGTTMRVARRSRAAWIPPGGVGRQHPGKMLQG